MSDLVKEVVFGPCHVTIELELGPLELAARSFLEGAEKHAGAQTPQTNAKLVEALIRLVERVREYDHLLAAVRAEGSR